MEGPNIENKALHALTTSIYAHFPPQLRALTYAFLLDEQTEGDIATLQCTINPSSYSTPTRKSSPTRVIIDLDSMDTNVAREIAGHFHAEYIGNRIIGATNITSFLHHDFLGVGVRPADVRIRRLEVYLKIEHTEPATLADAFEALLKPEQKWASGFSLQVRIRTDLEDAQLDYLLSATHAVLGALDPVLARTREKGGEGAVQVNVLECKRNKFLDDYRQGLWEIAYKNFVRDLEKARKEECSGVLPRPDR